MNVVIVGGGATGVEVSGVLAEMKRFVMPKDYPDLKQSDMNIYLIEGSPRLLGVMSTEASENAEKFLNFLCRPDIALKNFEYITYSTPNDAARELIEDDDIRNSEIAFPDEETLARCETFTYLGDDADEVYNQLWREVKSN